MAEGEPIIEAAPLEEDYDIQHREFREIVRADDTKMRNNAKHYENILRSKIGWDTNDLATDANLQKYRKHVLLVKGLRHFNLAKGLKPTLADAVIGEHTEDFYDVSIINKGFRMIKSMKSCEADLKKHIK